MSHSLETHNPPASPRIYVWLALAGIALAGCGAYANSFAGQFVFDDQEFILDNPRVHHFTWGSMLAGGGMRQLATASFAANYAVGGRDTFGYHGVNLAIHLLAGVVLFDLLRRLLLFARHDSVRAYASHLAAVVSLLWVVHPLQTQAVTYIVQRCESLMGLWYFLCLYGLVRGAQSSRAWPWYALAVVAVPLGIGGKESMVTAPLALLLVDRLLLSDDWRQLWRERKWLYLALAVPLIVMAPILVRLAWGGARGTVGFAVQDVSAFEYLRTQPGVIAHYLRLVVAPFPQCFDYQWPLASHWGAILPPVLFLVGLLALGMGHRRREPLLTLAVLLFFLHLAPTSSFVPIRDVAVEHRMYVPLAPVLCLLVVGGFTLLRSAHSPRNILIGVSIVAIWGVVLFGLTWRRNQLYHDPIALWSDTVATAPHNDRAFNNLSDALVKVKRYDEALAVLRQSLKLNPRNPTTQVGIANVLTEQGKLDEAVKHAAIAVQQKPDWAATHLNLGFVLSRQERYAEAELAYRAALKLHEASDVAHANLARVLHQTGKFREAVAHYDRAVEINADLSHLLPARELAAGKKLLHETTTQKGSLADSARAQVQRRQLPEAARLFAQHLQQHPDDALARAEYALVLAEQGEASSAQQHMQQAIEAAPMNVFVLQKQSLLLMRQRQPLAAQRALEAALEQDDANAETYFLLGNTLDAQGQTTKAVEHYERALEIDPKLARAHNNLGSIVSSRDPALAIKHFEAALSVDPQYVEALGNLGNALARSGRYGDAISCYRRALEIRPDFAPARRNLAAVQQMLQPRRAP